MAQENMGLADVFKLIFRILKWQFWILKQTVYGIGWVIIYFKAQSARASSPPVTDFYIPPNSWHEHCHIVAGSGHGKTQLLQHLIARDLETLRDRERSVIVIDSQGDYDLQNSANSADRERSVIVIDSQGDYDLQNSANSAYGRDGAAWAPACVNRSERR